MHLWWLDLMVGIAKYQKGEENMICVYPRKCCLGMAFKYSLNTLLDTVVVFFLPTIKKKQEKCFFFMSSK
jgi:hypothetical protein